MSMMETKVREILRIYRAQPVALAKALDALVETEVQRRKSEDVRSIAERVCQRKHPVGSAKLACVACLKAEMKTDDETLEELGKEIVT